MNRLNIYKLIIVNFTLFSSSINAENDLFQLDLEQLMKVKIVSVSKYEKSADETPAAVYVINRNDILRKGAITTAELLRGVPGLHVARIDANKWAVSIRGMNDRFANKLLVLVNGRSVYTPIFAGVYWNLQDMPLEIIERIEVVRGPGATLWGANAVNGVINIITRNSSEISGSEVSSFVSSEGSSVSSIIAKQIDDKTSYNIFAKGLRVDNFESDSSSIANDSWKKLNLGFRLDYDDNKDQKWLTEGSLTKGKANSTSFRTQLFPVALSTKFKDLIDYKTGHVLVRFDKMLDTQSKLKFQSYFDFFDRTSSSARYVVRTFDFDFQHQFNYLDKHNIVWGGGYRLVDDDLEPSFTISFNRKSVNSELYSLFIQDEYQVSENTDMTLGSKFEYNDFSGFEYQPSLRVSHLLDNGHHIWAGITRAVRVQSRSNHDLRINVTAFPASPPTSPLPTLVSILPNPDLVSETIISTEAGYRGMLNSDLSLDISIFNNQYDHLNSQRQGFSVENSPIPHFLLSSTIDNQIEAETYGLEAQVNWSVNKNLQLRSNYSYLKVKADYKNTLNADPRLIVDFENNNPQQQANFQVNWKINSSLDINSDIYYVSESQSRDINSYTRVDFNFQWRPSTNYYFSMGVTNLLDSHHQEFTAQDAEYSLIARNLFIKARVEF